MWILCAEVGMALGEARGRRQATLQADGTDHRRAACASELPGLENIETRSVSRLSGKLTARRLQVTEAQ